MKTIWLLYCAVLNAWNFGGAVCLLLAGSLWHKDCWVPCMERSYHRRPYAPTRGFGTLILCGIRDTIATPRKSPRHRDGPRWQKEPMIVCFLKRWNGARPPLQATLWDLRVRHGDWRVEAGGPVDAAQDAARRLRGPQWRTILHWCSSLYQSRKSYYVYGRIIKYNKWLE